MALRYWVGGTGNWNDTGHWSTSSGGGSGASVPTTGDDAIFDGSSGTGTCTINIAATPDSIDLQSTTSMTVTQSANPSVGSGGITVDGGTWSTAAYNVDTAGGLSVGSGGTWTTVGSSILNITGGNLAINASATVTWATGTVRFSGTSTQTLTCDEATATFYDLTISNTSGSDVDCLSDIRVSNVLTIDAGGKLDPSTAGPYDIYLEGAGTPLVLNGFIRGNGGMLIYEVSTGGTTYITGSTGWAINGGLTGMSILVQVIATVTATLRLSGDIQDVNNIQIESTAAGSSATVVFYSDNYDITVYSFIRIGSDTAANDCTFTSYWGSSDVSTGSVNFIRWQWSGATHNLQTSTWDTPTWSVYGPSTAGVDVQQSWDVGSSYVDCANVGESWMGLGAHDGIARFFDLQLNNPGGVAYIYIETFVVDQLTTADNGSTQETDIEMQARTSIDILELTATYAQQTVEFYETGQHYHATWTIGGTASYDLLFRSRVPTNQADVQLEDNATVSYMDIQDNNLSLAKINAYDGTNTDSGNNSANWLFTEPTVPVKSAYYRRRRV